MLGRILRAVLYACGAYLVVLLVALLLGAIGLPIASQVSAFLSRFAVAIAALVGIWQFLGGSAGISLP